MMILMAVLDGIQTMAVYGTNIHIITMMTEALLIITVKIQEHLDGETIDIMVRTVQTVRSSAHKVIIVIKYLPIWDMILVAKKLNL